MQMKAVKCSQAGKLFQWLCSPEYKCFDKKLNVFVFLSNAWVSTRFFNNYWFKYYQLLERG